MREEEVPRDLVRQESALLPACEVAFATKD